ncbi:MAG: ABC transporter substrate-binding protein [Gammaproteobacteria bacterium]|nr:ABC transporter substrate-binding protein [Gammaproteobacteria bacterium]
MRAAHERKARGARGFVALLVLLSALSAAAAPAEPRRIASMNLCTDQLLVALVDAQRIATLSFLIDDPAASHMPGRYPGIPRNRGQVEEIVGLQPDLVLAGRHAARTAVLSLRRLGYTVVELDIAVSLDDIADNVRRVAAAVHESARGERMIEQLRKTITSLQPAPTSAPRAVYLQPNMISSGAHTLMDALMQAAGVRNIGAELGLRGDAPLPLETLVSSAPDILVIPARHPDTPSLAHRLLRHPVIRSLASSARVLQVRDAHLLCGLPRSIEVAVALRKAATAAERRR